jgi:hypothetical protein
LRKLKEPRMTNNMGWREYLLTSCYYTRNQIT